MLTLYSHSQSTSHNDQVCSLVFQKLKEVISSDIVENEVEEYQSVRQCKYPFKTVQSVSIRLGNNKLTHYSQVHFWIHETTL